MNGDNSGAPPFPDIRNSAPQQLAAQAQQLERTQPPPTPPVHGVGDYLHDFMAGQARLSSNELLHRSQGAAQQRSDAMRGQFPQGLQGRIKPGGPT